MVQSWGMVNSRLQYVLVVENVGGVRQRYLEICDRVVISALGSHCGQNFQAASSCRLVLFTY